MVETIQADDEMRLKLKGSVTLYTLLWGLRRECEHLSLTLCPAAFRMLNEDRIANCLSCGPLVSYTLTVLA